MELSPAAADGEGFQLRPFSLPAGERTYQFLTGWISRLLRIGGWNLSGSDPSEIRARVEDLYAFAPGERTLGTLVHSLPSKMWPALGRWHGDGAWGRYFDNPADGDDLQFQDWQVIDMAGAAEHDDLCEAALFYLLERLRLAWKIRTKPPASSSWWSMKRGATFKIPPSFPISQKPPRHGARRTRR